MSGAVLAAVLLGLAMVGSGAASGAAPLFECSYPALTAGDRQTAADFVAMNSAGTPIDDIHQSQVGGQPTFVRSVFEADTSQIDWGSSGLDLSFDVAGTAPLDYTYRSELRETAINQAIPAGTTQAYCMRFAVDQLPDLYGPVTIFQRFNRDIDGPDIEVELTGLNQFGDAVANDLQVVAFDGRLRIDDMLEAENTLLVVVHNHATNGSYKVILNGRLLRAVTGLDTIGSVDGGWVQFGLYPHGLHDGSPNRADQIASGFTQVSVEYFDFTLTDIAAGTSDLSAFEVTAGALCAGQPVTIDMNLNGGDGTGTIGADVILGTPGADVILGRGGADTICAGAGADQVDGGPGSDTIFGEAGADLITGRGGQDTIDGGPSPDDLSGGAGHDVIRGRGGRDLIAGNDGPDALFGHGGDDRLRGGPAGDTLFGAAGADHLDGGPGADACADAEPSDTITRCS